jgi:ankyrin repeat protein
MATYNKTLKGSSRDPLYKQEGLSFFYFGSYKAVNETIKTKIEIQSSEITDQTQLALACAQGRFEKVVNLIECGLDINKKDLANFTPIMRAATNGHTSVVKLLVNYGAKISYELLSLIKYKINALEEVAHNDKENAYSVASWQCLLDYLIHEGKRQK